MPDIKARYILEAEDRTALALKKAKRGFKDLTGTVKGLGGPLLAIGSVTGLAALTSDALSSADAIAKTADKIGLSTDALQEYRFAAERTGVAQNALDMGLQRFSRRVGEVTQGTGVLKDVFEQYGIQVKDSEGKTRNLEDIMDDYADVIQGATSDQEKLRLAFKAFDAEGAAMVNTLRNGSSGLDELRQSARDAGVVLEEDLIRKAEKINDRWDTLTNTISVKFKSAVLSTLSFISGTSDITGLEKQIGGLNNRIKDLTDGIELYQQKIDELEAMDNDALTPAIDKLNGSLQSAKDEVQRLQKEIDRLNGRPIDVDAGQSDGDDKAGQRLAKQFDSALQSLQRAKAALGDVTQQERTLWEIQNGRYKDLSESQQNALLGAAKELDKRKAQLNAEKEAAETAEELQQKQIEYNQAQEDAAQKWRELLNPMEEVDQQLRELDKLLADGRISWETYGEAVFHVMGGMEEIEAKTEELAPKMNQFGIQAARNIQDSFSEFLFDPFENGIKGMADSFVNMLRKMAAEAASKQILSALFSYGSSAGGGIGEVFGSLLAGVQHTGGIAGSGITRNVPALAFVGAPRFHNGGILGLASNEVPTILEKGEGVFTKQQMAAMGGASVTVNIQTPDPQAFRQSQQQISTQIGAAVNRAMRRNT